MQLVDRIEKRRFVGREFLLWLWFESELFDATLRTKTHGSFGLWFEKRLVLSEGKKSTRITAPLPAAGREAKEALLAGQLPESAGIRIALGDDETSFVLKAEQLGVSVLKLQSVLSEAQEPPSPLIEEMKGGGRGRKGRGQAPADESHEIFYERMRLTQQFEALLEALYRDFIALRLSDSWTGKVVPLAQAWARGESVDAEVYAALKTPSGKGKSGSRSRDERAVST